MKIEEDGTVVFKSEPYYFKEERDGLKPNTERLLTEPENNNLLYDETKPAYLFCGRCFRVHQIRIEPTRIKDITGAELKPFTRELTSIMQIGELCGYYLFVFSWQHEE